MHFKRGMPTTCLIELDPLHRLRITMTIQRVKYAAVLVHTINSTAVNNHLFAPQTKKQVCI